MKGGRVWTRMGDGEEMVEEMEGVLKGRQGGNGSYRPAEESTMT